MSSHQELEEIVLVRHAQNGGQEAFAILVERYDRRVGYYVRRLLCETRSDLVFDVMQSTWLQVHRRLHSLRSPEAFRVWLFRIAHDQVVSELRRQRLSPTSLDGESIDVSDARSDASQVELENAELVHRALDRMTLEHRQVLTLRFLEDMSVEQIADVTGVPAGTVKSRLHYARLALRSCIEEMENG